MEIRTGAEIAREVYPYKDTKGRTVYLVQNRARHYLTKCVAADELAKELEIIANKIDSYDYGRIDSIHQLCLLVEKLREGRK